MRSAFDGDCFVNNVALDPCCGGQADLKAAQATNNTTMNNNVICHDLAFDGGAFADCQLMRTNVAVNCTFDLNVTCCGDVAFDREVR